MKNFSFLLFLLRYSWRAVFPSFSKHRPRHSSESAASSRRTKSSLAPALASHPVLLLKVQRLFLNLVETLKKSIIVTITHQGKKIFESSDGIAYSLPEEASAASLLWLQEEMTTIIREGMHLIHHVAAKSLKVLILTITADKNCRPWLKLICKGQCVGRGGKEQFLSKVLDWRTLRILHLDKTTWVWSSMVSKKRCRASAGALSPILQIE